MEYSEKYGILIIEKLEARGLEFKPQYHQKRKTKRIAKLGHKYNKFHRITKTTSLGT
jgi:hypothetical protein